MTIDDSLHPFLQASVQVVFSQNTPSEKFLENIPILRICCIEPSVTLNNQPTIVTTQSLLTSHSQLTISPMKGDAVEPKRAIAAEVPDAQFLIIVG